jgi:hypothetical protein
MRKIDKIIGLTIIFVISYNFNCFSQYENSSENYYNGFIIKRVKDLNKVLKNDSSIIHDCHTISSNGYEISGIIFYCKETKFEIYLKKRIHQPSTKKVNEIVKKDCIEGKRIRKMKIKLLIVTPTTG